MKNRNETVRTRFAPEVRFEVNPLPFRAVETTALEQLKNQLLRARLQDTAGTPQNIALRRAANDAAALAWNTNFPLLVFPALFEEKAQVALVQAARQACVRERSRNLFLEAA